MKTVASITQTADIRRRRRNAQKFQRVVAGNIRSAASDVHTGPIRLARAANIRTSRMLLAWLGLRISVPDMCRMQQVLGMSLDDVFRGTAKNR